MFETITWQISMTFGFKMSEFSRVIHHRSASQFLCWHHANILVSKKNCYILHPHVFELVAIFHLSCRCKHSMHGASGLVFGGCIFLVEKISLIQYHLAKLNQNISPTGKISLKIFGEISLTKKATHFGGPKSVVFFSVATRYSPRKSSVWFGWVPCGGGGASSEAAFRRELRSWWFYTQCMTHGPSLGVTRWHG